MAEPDLIDAYVASLRRHVRSRSDVEDVVAEVEDHLRQTATVISSGGIPERAAQREALTRFGDPRIINQAFAATPSGGIVMPTRFSRLAGATAFVAAGLWVGAAVLWSLSSGLFAPFSEERFVIAMVAISAATLASVVVVAGILARSGWPSETVLAFLFGGGAFLVLTVMPWTWPITGLLLGAAFLVVVLLSIRMTGRRLRLQWALVAAWPLGFLVFGVLTAAELGPVDEWGDYPLANGVGFAVAAGLMVVGLTAIGSWLVAERSVQPRVAVA